MSKNNKERYCTKHLTICQGDVLLVNFGKKTAGCRTGGIKPCVVVSNDSSLKTDTGFFVIPLYRKASKSSNTEDILIRTVDCRGLRYEEYAQPMNMVLCHKCRAVKKIGHIKNDSIIKEITLSLWNMVEDDAG
jgi:mRNA-degrading endonuclease toxin of MazEF toxin-antitoxin module